MTDETRGPDPGPDRRRRRPEGAGELTCDEALEGLLEADLRQLRGEGESELAVHVRGCPRCRAVAAELVAGEVALARALEGIAPVSADDALPRITRRGRRGRPKRAWWRWAAPLAAAAAAAGLLFLRGGDRGTIPFREGAGAGVPRAEAGAGDPFRVSAPEGRDVVVFETGDPDITVVWLY